MVDEIFDNRGQGPDELNLIKKNMRFPGLIRTQLFIAPGGRPMRLSNAS